VKKVSIAIAALVLMSFLALPVQGEENRDLWSLSTFIQSAKIQYQHVYKKSKLRSDLYVSIDLMRDASRRYPHVPEVYFMLGTFFTEIHALDTMVAYFDSLETYCADQSVDAKYRTDCYKSKEGFLAKVAAIKQKYWEESFNDGANYLTQYDTVVAAKKRSPEDSIKYYDSLRVAAFDITKSSFEQSILVRPKDSLLVRSYTALGALYQRDERYLDAVEAYKSGMKISGESAEAVSRIANAYISIPDWKNSIVWFERYLDYISKPETSSTVSVVYVNTLINLSIAYNQIDDFDKGYEYTERLLKEDSSNVQGLSAAGQYWFFKMQESISAMSEIADSVPNAEAKRKEMEAKTAELRSKAIEYFDKVITNDPENAVALRRLGLLYLLSDKNQQAAEVFEKYIAIDPNDVSILDFLGRAYIRLQNLDKAIATYETIVNNDPGNISAWEELETLYNHTNQSEKAEKAAATVKELKKM